MIDKLFTYGTLEIPSVVERVLGRRLSGRPAVLHGYGRYLVRGECYPAIREQPQSSVSGTLYDGLDAELFRRLDKYEGEEYGKHAIEVVTEDGRRHRAIAYTCGQHLLGDAPWNQAEFIEGHLEKFLTERSPWIE